MKLNWKNREVFFFKKAKIFDDIIPKYRAYNLIVDEALFMLYNDVEESCLPLICRKL